MFRLFILGMVFALPISWAEESGMEFPSLSLQQAVQLVLEKNPQLLSAPFGREASIAHLEQAALKPLYSIDLQVEDFAGSGFVSGFGAAETTLRLSRIFEPSDLRSGRVSVATAQGDQLENDLEAQRLDLMTTLARRFVAVIYQQESQQLARESVSVWQRATEMAQVRERAGVATAVDRMRTELRAINARLQVEDAEHELMAARVSLAATWADTTPSFAQAEGEMCGFTELASFEVVATNLERNPDLLRFATERRLHEANAQLASARRRPGWFLSAGVRRLEQLDDQALVFGVSVPLGSSKRASYAYRSANALRRQAEYQERAERLDIRATLYEIYQELIHSRTEVEILDAEILPRANAIVSQVEDGYRVGRFTHLELINAQAELLAAQAARIQGCSDYQLYLISIERLTGGGAVWLANGLGVSP